MSGIPREISITAAPAKSIKQALEEKGIILCDSCAGAGHCGRCRIRFISCAPNPDAKEKALLSETELREGVRLACMHKADSDCVVQPVYIQPSERSIVSQGVFSPRGGTAQWSDDEWGIAIDLGTTTIVMQAFALRTAEPLGVQKCLNPQRHFGSDVMARIQAALSGKAEMLRDMVSSMLLEGIAALKQQVNRGEPAGIWLAGNTVMEHLLAGLPVDGMSRFPFSPVTLAEQSITLLDNRGSGHCAQRITLLPGFSAFVGADLMAGVLACGMDKQEKITLLVDLGTNGEIVLGNREKLMCTATAAGPAFEGGVGSNISATDMIAVVANLLDAGIVDQTGLLTREYFDLGAPYTIADKAEPGVITQAEIRAIQVAKAAICAGIRIIAKEYGIELSDIRQVWLAGGFGYYLDVQGAAKIGLFPPELDGKVTAVGNTSLTGALLYGRDRMADAAAQIAQRCTAINLAQYPQFDEMFVSSMYLGAVDALGLDD